MRLVYIDKILSFAKNDICSIFHKRLHSWVTCPIMIVFVMFTHLQIIFYMLDSGFRSPMWSYRHVHNTRCDTEFWFFRFAKLKYHETLSRELDGCSGHTHDLWSYKQQLCICGDRRVWASSQYKNLLSRYGGYHVKDIPILIRHLYIEMASCAPFY